MNGVGSIIKHILRGLCRFKGGDSLLVNVDDDVLVTLLRTAVVLCGNVNPFI